MFRRLIALYLPSLFCLMCALFVVIPFTNISSFAQGASAAVATPRSKFVPVYAMPQQSEKPWGFAVEGKEYVVVSRRDGWVSIQFFDDNGWVREQDVNIKPAPQSAAAPGALQPAQFDRVTITEQYAKVTAGPNPKSKIVAFALKGEEFAVLGMTGDYLRIRYKQTNGYIPLGSCVPTETVQDRSTPEVPANRLTADSIEALLLSSAGRERADTPKTSGGDSGSGQRYLPDLGLPTPMVGGAGRQYSSAMPAVSGPVSKGSGQNSPANVSAKSGPSRQGPANDTARQIFGSPALIVDVPVPGEDRPAKTAYQLRDKVDWVPLLLSRLAKLPWYYLAALMVLPIGAAAALGVWMYRLLFSLPRSWRRMAGKSHECVVVGEAPLYVLVGILGRTLTLDKFLNAGGYRLRHFDDGAVAGVSLKHSIADVLFVHWSRRKEIRTAVGEMLLSSKGARNLKCIYYGVPESAKTAEYRVSNAVHFIGASVPARQLVNLIRAPNELVRGRSADLRLSTENYSLQGAIGGDTLSEVLQYLETVAKSGCLLVERNGPFGMIFFEKGVIVHSSTKQAQDERAVREILGLPDGTFRFVSTNQPFVRTTHLSTMSILMEWAQFKDENVLEKFYTRERGS